jgi:tetratricopeptide (TPR) repeat protein
MPRRLSCHADVRPLTFRATLLVFVLAVATSTLHAKETPLTVIAVFDGPSGAAAVQISDFLINGKAEVRGCGGATQINKSVYGKLPKIALNASVTSLERDSKGVMNLTRESGSECVLPSNLKFEKDESLTPAQLADRAVLQGQVLAASPAGISAVPTFKPTVKIVFVAAPDTELAEYLRSDRAHSVQQWQDYLGRYPKAPHTASAKQFLASLFLQEGSDNLATYKSSASTSAPAYPNLRSAFLRAADTLTLIPGSAGGAKLRDDVHTELVAVAEKSRSELLAYKQALAGNTTGYVHLANSRQLAEHTLEVDPQFDQGLALQASIATETQRVDSALQKAESLSSSQRYDEAVKTVADFRSFAGEEPRIAAVIDGAYKNHFDRGKAAATDQKWHDAVQEYQKALDIKHTPDAASALKQAQAEYQTSTNRAAADAAIQQSSAFQQDKKFIEAYEVLANLPEAQRSLVREQMEVLEPDYIKSAVEEARKLHDAHIPIQGRMDEIGIEKAHDYLQRACSLQPEDQDLRLRLSVVDQTLSDYYVAQAKKYFDKPLGSGVGLAWLYLDEAQQYQPNRDDVRDERTKYAAAHNIRSKLSVKVAFRDQTSRRDSAGFADQLSDAIATGLETTSLPVRIIRAADITPVDPNFQLVGDVLEHRAVSKPTIESIESEYRAAEREIPNEDWNKANRTYEATLLDLQKAQRVLEGAQAHGKKKEIADAESALEDAQKRVEDAHSKLDAIPKTVLSDVVKPYSYTRRTIDLSAMVELGFRMVDANGNTLESTPSIKNSNQKQFVLLENVKPEDTKNVRQSGTLPDEIQFLSDVEIAARTALVKDVKEKVQSLPPKIFAQAHKHLADGDTDGTAESYILYLNSTPEASTPERDEAKKFLREQFNIEWRGQS